MNLPKSSFESTPKFSQTEGSESVIAIFQRSDKLWPGYPVQPNLLVNSHSNQEKIVGFERNYQDTDIYLATA
jgi:hypothetical protein